MERLSALHAALHRPDSVNPLTGMPYAVLCPKRVKKQTHNIVLGVNNLLPTSSFLPQKHLWRLLESHTHTPQTHTHDLTQNISHRFWANTGGENDWKWKLAAREVLKGLGFKARGEIVQFSLYLIRLHCSQHLLPSPYIQSHN